ncbi:hypothetical protein ACG9HX_09195 [Acinetobacter ursingii]|uniref:Uncharacterized protein n=1 Tax=Acinetobacter ursingii TaxID=108980 RepID=A0AA46NUH4_9GAMM|nr:hypothetical protein [Acinetobacter ursingii]UYF71148.1 hypothetical protein LSO60_12940 [Acinetobacter ursingii]VTX86408.1 Uncharacterised protein [Acinetobacter ursingii]
MLSIQLLTCAIIALLQNYIAIQLKALYSESVQCKIIGLAVEGYKLQGAQSVIWTFFVRNISMRSHFMAKLERDAFERTGNLVVLSSNPFQLCHPHLEVNGKAPISTRSA